MSIHVYVLSPAGKGVEKTRSGHPMIMMSFQACCSKSAGSNLEYSATCSDKVYLQPAIRGWKFRLAADPVLRIPSGKYAFNNEGKRALKQQ